MRRVMPRNLIITGGIFHPFEASSAALADVLAEAGIDSETTFDMTAGLESLSGDAYAMVTINALRWGMMTAEKYAPYRAEWAYRIPESSRRALTGFVEAGGALLGMHTASICFDDWPGWQQLLGGQWVWGRSHHPPLGEVRARPVSAAHPVTDGVAPFTVNDEVYHGLALEPDVVGLLEADAGEGPQPLVWAREVGRGRVVYDALGHDAASICEPEHRRLLRQAGAWLTEARRGG
jgi:type 1 glutamine amidotransferase